MKNIAIFASGTGSNAVKIMDYFENNVMINVGLIISNNPHAKVLKTAQNRGVDYEVISSSNLNNPSQILPILKNKNIDLIILAGFLLLIPSYMIKAYPDRILNIHPALLPKYGGKGMYGHHVHKAVYDNKEKESGITIHYVNEKYDDGAIIFREKVLLNENDTPDKIAAKVLNLEHKYYKKIIEQVLS